MPRQSAGVQSIFAALCEREVLSRPWKERALLFWLCSLWTSLHWLVGPESYQRLFHYFAQSLSVLRDNAHKVLSKDQAHSNCQILVTIITLENETSPEKQNQLSVCYHPSVNEITNSFLVKGFDWNKEVWGLRILGTEGHLGIFPGASQRAANPILSNQVLQMQMV